MPRLPLPLSRQLAAIFAVCLGAAHVASLWFRALDEAAVASLLLGTVYLIIGLGLFGRSRFTLYIAVAVPATVAAFRLHYAKESLPLLALLADFLMLALAVSAIWRNREERDR